MTASGWQAVTVATVSVEKMCKRAVEREARPVAPPVAGSPRLSNRQNNRNNTIPPTCNEKLTRISGKVTQRSNGIKENNASIYVTERKAAS